MRRTLAWVSFAILTVLAIYGIVHERLFEQVLWYPEGAARFAGFAIAFWLVAGGVITYRPRWLGPLTAAFVLIYTVAWCWRFFDAAAPMAVIYFLGSSFFLGRIISRRADELTSLLLGTSVWIFILSILVWFPINTRIVYVAALAVPYAMAWRRVKISWPRISYGTGRRRDALALAVLLFVLLMHWLVALKPEISSDGLAMHLTIPMAVAYDRRWAFDFTRYTWALMPMGGDWAYTWVYLLGGEAAPRLLDFSFLLVICAMIYRTSRTWLEPAAAYIAVALFASTPLVQLVTGSLFIENIWAALILGAALTLWRGELIWAAILLGAALSTKLGTTAYLLPALALAASRKPRWQTAIVATGLFVMFASPPYLNSWMKTHNPVFPFLNHVFKSPQFTTEPDAMQDVRYLQKLSLKTPYDVTFHSSVYFEGQNGSLGFQYFLLFVPLVILATRASPLALIAFGATGALVTFTAVPNLRYLYPALPLLSIGFAWLISQLPALALGLLLMIAANIWFLPASGWNHKDFALFRRSQVEDYRSSFHPEAKLFDYLNVAASGETVAFIGGSPIAGLNARAYVDDWHTFEFWRTLTRAKQVEDIVTMFQRFGIRYVIARVPFETDRSIVRYFVEQWTVPTGVTSGRDVLYRVIQLPVVPPHQRLPAGPGSYDDLDPEIEYRGTWLHDQQFRRASGGSISYSNHADDELRFTFSGSTITYFYTKAANRGFAQVTIDGLKRADINEYSSGTIWQSRRLFSDLGEGQHTVEVRVLGQKDPDSTGTWVDLDRFVVNP